MPKEKKRANWLLRGFILISMGIHILIFFHFAGIYENQAISYIELSLNPVSKPDVRRIPKPIIRVKAPEILEPKAIQVKTAPVPRIKIDTIKEIKTDHSFERITLPSLPDTMNIADFSVSGLDINRSVADTPAYEEQVEYTSAKEYLEMLNLRIQSVKKYPETAKARHIEGRVKVQFVLSADGSLSDIQVIKSSHHNNLDEAAVEAIKNASPFPRPPAFILKAPITLKVNILFELA